MMLEHTANLEADVQNRKRALELASFIVEAPAGAGKTELLTQRYLKLLPTVDAPEEIIAITFTNKAAAEMRLRIMDSLMKATANEVPTLAHKLDTYDLAQKALAHAQQKNWHLIENPSRLRIFTIDSLCAHLARQMPLMSRFGAQPGVALEPEALYAEAAERTLSLLENAQYRDTVSKALRYVDNDANQLKRLLISMLEKRDQWLHHASYEADAGRLQQTLQTMVAQDLRPVLRILPQDFQQRLMPVARYAASNLADDEVVALLKDWQTPVSASQQDLRVWRALTDLLLTGKGELRKLGGLTVKNGFPPNDEGRAMKAVLADLIAEIADPAVLHHVRALPDIQSDHSEWEMIGILAQLLTLAAAQLWLVFQHAGEVDFVEIAQRATQALADEAGEPTELALKLDYKIQHLLVDEFQDTSPGQIELLRRLTAGWQAGDQRTLFAVGDPMQSIYRFRKANVGLFIEAAQIGIGDVALERLQLFRNNRSCPEIVDWINHGFARIFPSQDEITRGAIHYRPFIATRDSLPDAGVMVHPVLSHTQETSTEAQQREAQAVVDIIISEREHHSDREIAVLVRSKKHLAQLVSILRREHQHIRFQAVEIEALEGRQVVQDLLSLTYALHQRADRVHWLAILRAPWCGLCLQDMHALAGQDHQSTIWSLMQNDEQLSQLTEDGRARLLHVRDILHEAFDHQGRMSVSRWVRNVWLMLNGPECLWEKSDVVDVQAFFDCMDRLDRANQFSPERMADEITKLFAAPDSQGGKLQMMTIHKSKGLQFDTVILPGLGTATGGNNSDKPLIIWEETEIGGEFELMAAAFMPKSLRSKDKVSAYDYLAAREKLRDTNEAARVLYVAVTRTVRKLHLVGVANLNSDDAPNPAKNTFLELLWPQVEADFNAAVTERQTAVEHDDFAGFVPKLVRLKQPQIPQLLQHTQTLSGHQSQNVKPDMSLGSLEADIGTLAHRYMELIARDGLQAWPLERIATLQQSMQHWLMQQGHASDRAMNAAQKVQHLLETTLKSADGQWVLQPRQQAASELAMSDYSQGKLKQYIVDRTFIEDGIRWIVDYKTAPVISEVMSEIKSEIKSEQDLQALAQMYKPQLENYARLFVEQGLPVKCAIFFMQVGRLIPLNF